VLANLPLPPDEIGDRLLRRWWNLTQVAYLLLPLFPVVAVAGLAIALLGVTHQRWRQIVERPVNRGFAAIALLMLLSTAFAHYKTDALLGLANFLPFFWVFATLAEILQTPAQLRRLTWILVITSVPVVLIGLAQEFLRLGLEWHWSIVEWTIAPQGSPPGRISSVFVYANVLASYFCITLVMSLGLWIGAIREKKLFSSQVIGLSLVVLGNAMALGLTDSRNAWAIALLVGLVFAIYLGWYWLLALVTAIATSCLGAAFAPAPLSHSLRQVVPSLIWMRLNDQLHPDRPLAQLRTTQWQFAIDLVQQRPWLGWGLRNFNPLYYQAKQFYIGHPHNLLLMLACETGILTALLFLAVVGWVVYRAVQTFNAWSSQPRNLGRCPPAGYRLLLFTWLTAFMGCALFSLLDITLFDVRINLLGWLLLGAIAGITYHWEQSLQLDLESDEAG
jgi:O-antigen ligase